MAIGTLVAFILLKAYTGKVLTQLRRECSSLITSERHARQEREREESLVESAEARLLQLQSDLERTRAEVEELTARIEQVEGDLRRLKEEEGESPAADAASG